MTSAAIDVARPSPGARAAGWAELRAAALSRAYPETGGADLLRAMIEVEFPGRIAVASSFGAEAAVLLALIAEIDRAVPVIVLDTEKLFDETHAYIRRLTDHLGLTDVRPVRPDPSRLAAHDPGGTLWSHDPESCCRLRKVEPLRAALAPFEAWVSGRKRLHGEARVGVPAIDAVDGHVVVSPLAHWTRHDLDAAFTARGLPRHPLAAGGYASIGCRPCTRPIESHEPVRAGRWSGTAKTECGIHRPALF